MSVRNRTPSSYIGYGLHVCFSGLSLRRVSERLPCFIRQNQVSIGSWIQKHHPQRISPRSKKVSGFMVYKALVKAGSDLVWPWVAIEPKNKQIFAPSISKARNMLVAGGFTAGLVEIYGRHSVSTEGGTGYPQACRFLKPKHHIHHPSFEKSITERTMRYIKDGIECFGGYFPC